MRRDVLELREFYAQPLGRAVRDLLSRKVGEAWGDAAGLDVLGLGYATPFLDRFAAARRVVAAMPRSPGGRDLARRRPQPGLSGRETRPCRSPTPCSTGSLSCTAWRKARPPAPCCARPGACWRRRAASSWSPPAAAACGRTPSGRPSATAARSPAASSRPWCARPTWSRSAWSQALYVPPLTPLARWADGFEQVGSRVWPGFAGLVLLEAVKRTFALKAKPVRARLANPLPGVLAPQPATVPAGMTHRRLRPRR